MVNEAAIAAEAEEEISVVLYKAFYMAYTCQSLSADINCLP